MKIVNSFLATLVVLICTSLQKVPAIAAGTAPEIPTGQELLVMTSCNSDSNNGQLLRVSTDGAATSVGVPNLAFHSNDCFDSSAFNPVTSQLHYIHWSNTDSKYFLNLVNANTGNSSRVAEVTWAQSMTDAEPWLIYITNTGVAYTLNRDYLYSLNLTSGAMSRLAPFDDDETTRGNSAEVGGFDKTTSTFYVISNVDWKVRSLNVSTGFATAIATQPTWPTVTCANASTPVARPTGAIAFDKNGIGWMLDQSCPNGRDSLVAWNPATGETWGYPQLHEVSTPALFTATNGTFYAADIWVRDISNPSPTTTPVSQPASTASSPIPTLAKTGGINYLGAFFSLMFLSIGALLIFTRHYLEK